MSVLDEMTSAFGELQRVFNATALVNGITVPVSRGQAVQLGEHFEDGGVIQTQAISLSFAIAGNPVPQTEQTVVFNGLSYRIWRVQNNVATWVIDCLQLTAD
jgi:hypothetical protein